MQVPVSRSRPAARWLATAATLTALIVAACGGGGADGGIGGTGGGGGGGIGGTGVAYGEITGFGSVWVNGVRYDTASASFVRDGVSVSQADLRIGMVARVEGDAAAATASRVSVDSAVRGRVERVDGDVFVAMGQTVRTDAGTVFDGGQRPVAGDDVEVHGLPLADGVIVASYVERKVPPASPPFAVTGFVAAHDTVASTLTIGSLTVRYAGASVDGLPAGSWVGLLVEAKGSACAGTPVCATLTANRLQVSGPRIDSSPQAEIEGYVSALTANGFVLGAQTVVVDAGTQFEDGSAADLVVGSRVEVEGSITGGVLTARQIEFEAGVRVEADVLAVAGDRITLAGLPGLEVQVGSGTEVGGLEDTESLRPGLHLKLKGRPVGAALVVATEVEVEDASTTLSLRGGASAAADPVLTMLGVAVDTTGLPDAAFVDGETTIGRAAFFAALSAGRAVRARGTLRSGAVTWNQLSLAD